MQKRRFAWCFTQSWDKALLLAPDVFWPFGDRTAHRWVSQKGDALTGRPTKVPPAALSRVALEQQVTFSESHWSITKKLCEMIEHLDVAMNPT